MDELKGENCVEEHFKVIEDDSINSQCCDNYIEPHSEKYASSVLLNFDVKE